MISTLIIRDRNNNHTTIQDDLMQEIIGQKDGTLIDFYYQTLD